MSYILHFTFIILTLTFIDFSKSEMKAENVVLAINCGGESFTDSRGIAYKEDMFVDIGQSSEFGTQFDIKNTQDQKAYQTERWAESDFTYKLPISEGKYVLVLKFSEVYFNNAKEKIFDVMVGKKKVVASLDIYGKVGKSTAYDEFIEFEVKGGKVYIVSKQVENGYEEERVIVIFKKGERDNPKVNAILVVRGSLEDTDYAQFNFQLEELEKEKLEKEKKQREIKKRNSLHYEFEEYEEDFTDTEHLRKSELFNSFNLLVITLLVILVYKAFIKPYRTNKEKDE